MAIIRASRFDAEEDAWEFIADLEKQGFVNRGGKGSHRTIRIRAWSGRSRFPAILESR